MNFSDEGIKGEVVQGVCIEEWKDKLFNRVF